MGYELIDPIIDAWAQTHRLHVYKEYKEMQVRSVEYRAGRRGGYQIWIDEPGPDGLIGVHVWDFRRIDRGGRRRDFQGAPPDLREHLESALRIANEWIGETKLQS